MGVTGSCPPWPWPLLWPSPAPACWSPPWQEAAQDSASRRTKTWPCAAPTTRARRVLPTQSSGVHGRVQSACERWVTDPGPGPNCELTQAASKLTPYFSNPVPATKSRQVTVTHMQRAGSAAQAVPRVQSGVGAVLGQLPWPAPCLPAQEAPLGTRHSTPVLKPSRAEPQGEAWSGSLIRWGPGALRGH